MDRIDYGGVSKCHRVNVRLVENICLSRSYCSRAYDFDIHCGWMPLASVQEEAQSATLQDLEGLVRVEENMRIVVIYDVCSWIVCFIKPQISMGDMDMECLSCLFGRLFVA